MTCAAWSRSCCARASARWCRPAWPWRSRQASPGSCSRAPGWPHRLGITCANSPGLVDPNYRGELRVVLVNLGREIYRGHAGDRIAQLLLVPYWAPELRVVDELPDSERGEPRASAPAGAQAGLPLTA